MRKGVGMESCLRVAVRVTPIPGQRGTTPSSVAETRSSVTSQVVC